MCVGASSDARDRMEASLLEFPDTGLDGVLPCEISVEVHCLPDGSYKAVGRPVRPDGRCVWTALDPAELRVELAKAWVERTTQPRVRMRAEYVVDGVGSASATVVRYMVPKLFHFVWAGGARIMRPDAFASVKRWAENHPGFKVWIWVDEASDPDCAGKYAEEYGADLGRLGIELRDITTGQVVTEHVRYEIDKLWPNYGGSSDLLRYAILHRHGGIYFDADVPLGTDLLMGYGYCSPLVANDNSQNTRLVGNDAFICMPGDPTMAKLMARARDNYLNLDIPPPNADFHEEYVVRREATIRRTGPTMVRRLFKEEGLLEQEDSKLPPQHRFPPGVVQIPEVETNTEGWLKVPVRRMAEAAAVQAAAGSMQFEIERMGLFRTVDHVAQVAVSAGIVLAEFRRLDEYAGDFFTIDRAQPVGVEEGRLAAALQQELAALSPDLSVVAAQRAKFPRCVETTCRYPVFQAMYDRCRS